MVLKVEVLEAKYDAYLKICWWGGEGTAGANKKSPLGGVGISSGTAMYTVYYVLPTS